MNTEQKLTKIREKCVELLEDSKKYGTVCLGKETGAAEAGWKATIAAIDNALIVFDEILASEIITAWEGLV